MRDSVYQIALDVHKSVSQMQITAKKNDTARTLYATLNEDGKPYNIEPGSSAVIMIRKPGGTVLMNDCAIRSDGTIIYEFTAQTVSAEGLCECELRLYGQNNQILTSPRFTILVNETVYDDGQVESQDEFTTLTNAISACNNLNVALQQSTGSYTITITKKDGSTESATLSDGAKGAKGDTGAQGPKGEKGEQGEKGEKGDTGGFSYPTFSIETDGVLYANIPDSGSEISFSLNYGYLEVNV